MAKLETLRKAIDKRYNDWINSSVNNSSDNISSAVVSNSNSSINASSSNKIKSNNSSVDAKFLQPTSADTNTSKLSVSPRSSSLNSSSESLSLFSKTPGNPSSTNSSTNPPPKSPSFQNLIPISSSPAIPNSGISSPDLRTQNKPNNSYFTNNNSSMTPAELYSGLKQISESTSDLSVLIFDIRPMEDYIQGHIKWNVINAGLKNNNSGLVHLEPDWIHSGYIYLMRLFA